MKLYRDYTKESFSFLVSDTIIPSDYTNYTIYQLYNLDLGRIYNKMAVREKIKINNNKIHVFSKKAIFFALASIFLT